MRERGFELIQETEIVALNTRVLRYKHRTGAEVLSLLNQDENKVFGINFRTPPTDSTGIAHILEHSVLCGSRKYPVKEPFVELLKGSLSTFLNAYTFPDKTCYPVASQNVQDFYNLVDVYLDAVFHPRLTPQVLQQEGWHYELENRGDPLVYKGVVFNEMKGAYSSSDTVLAKYVQQSLFPDNTYGVDSGGDPRHIPDLTYAQFEAFHRRYYHPANARIFFYGDDDPQQRLGLLGEYLGEFEPASINSAIELQPRFAAPRRLLRSYAVSPEGIGLEKNIVAVNWMLDGDVKPQLSMAFHILEHILIGTPASPLRQALIESGLGEDLAGVGLADELRQFYFSTGLKGVEGKNVEAVETLVLSTLEEVAAAGIDAGAIAAALNTAEFRLRENNTGSYPRGLVLMRRALTTWLYDRDPCESMEFAAPLAACKERLAGDERFLEGLIRSYFLDNTHRTTLILEPDPQLQARAEAEEKNRLEEVRMAMGPDDLRELVGATHELKRQQEAPDTPAALASLPHLQLGDLERRAQTLPLEVTSQRGIEVLYHDLPTNGIVYLDLGFDLHGLPQEYLPYIPLFGRALMEMGTEKDSFVELDRRIGAGTGGIWPQTLVCSPRRAGESVCRFFLRGKAMRHQVDEFLDILKDILLAAVLDDKERFYQMALEEKAGEESSLVAGGHRVVSLRLRSHFEEAAWISEQMGGISYLLFLRQLVRDIDQNWPLVLSRLEDIRCLLLQRSALLCNATLEEGDRAILCPRLDGLIEALPNARMQPQNWIPVQPSPWEGLGVPAQVNYVGKGANLYDLGYELHGSVSVVTRYLSTTWLWDRIRVRGGAYGAFCFFDSFTGVFSCVSYRDPNLLESLEVYDSCADFLRAAELGEQELRKAIIGTIGDMDAYQLPDAKGYTSMVRYLAGITEEYRQSIRDQVLETRAVDFVGLAKFLDHFADQGRVVVMGAPEALEGLGTERGNSFEMTKVL